MNIFIFHRDFRINDNMGLAALAKEEKQIYLIFIFTDEQIKKNSYFSQKSFQAMVFCLKELSKTNTVNFLEAESEHDAILNLIKDGKKINKIYTNKDYTPYAEQRSKKMQLLSSEQNFIYKEFSDYLLFSTKKIKKPDHSFYQVFTPFWNEIRFNHAVPPLVKVPNFEQMKLKESFSLSKYKDNDFGLPLTKNKVTNAIKNLSKDYQTTRDQIWNENGTSHISCALKYGVISIREAHKLAIDSFGHFDNGFSRQLVWRDFFYQATYNAQKEKTWKFGNNWYEKMDKLQWSNNKELFEKWKTGSTGVPLVDAGIKELNSLGTMHNRVRLVCGSYLVKNLNIDWKWGEKYFAQHLVDYDPIINQCSWQWVSGTGFDAQPYIRIFNPFIQQEKFDPDKKYIKKFLKNDQPDISIEDYKKTVAEAKERFQKLK